MEERKYELFVKLLKALRENAETGAKVMSETIKSNSNKLSAHNAQLWYEGKADAIFDVLELLRDEKYFYQMIDVYSIRG